KIETRKSKLENRRSGYAGDFAFWGTRFSLFQASGQFGPQRCLGAPGKGRFDLLVFVTMLVRITLRKKDRGRAEALWRIAAPQFSTFHCRSAGFAGWHLDAIHRTTLARI